MNTSDRPDLPRSVRGLSIEMDVDLHLVDVRKGSLSATFLPSEVVNRVRSDGLALRGPSIRPDSYRPVATLDERDRLSVSGSPTHPAKWRGGRHRDRACECVVRSPRRDQAGVAELVGVGFRGDGFGTLFGHSS
jgi:hypothetical protein